MSRSQTIIDQNPDGWARLERAVLDRPTPKFWVEPYGGSSGKPSSFRIMRWHTGDKADGTWEVAEFDCIAEPADRAERLAHAVCRLLNEGAI